MWLKGFVGAKFKNFNFMLFIGYIQTFEHHASDWFKIRYFNSFLNSMLFIPQSLLHPVRMSEALI